VIVGFKEKTNPFFGKILDWAIGVGERFPSKGVEAISVGFQLKLWLADLLVFRRWRRSLGGRIEGIVVGASALQPRLARLFSAAKIPIREGYGLTETSPVLTFNRFEPGGNYFGTVGLPVPGVEIRISAPNDAHEGEIEVRGPNVFMGYLNQPTETAAMFTDDGWLKTGDVGTFAHRRFLKITGRRKDIFKTSSGKFVSPQFVENQLVTSDFIENALVIGLNKPMVTALILPDFGTLEKWCATQKIHWTAPQFMVINPKVERFFQKIIDEKNEQLASHERIRAHRLLFEKWSPETGELTPTLKTRRPFLMEKFKEEISELYP
jgi:long-chain acyl-CoA synthetase